MWGGMRFRSYLKIPLYNFRPQSQLPIHLKKGENVLELRSDIGGSELKISRIEIRENS